MRSHESDNDGLIYAKSQNLWEHYALKEFVELMKNLGPIETEKLLKAVNQTKR